MLTKLIYTLVFTLLLFSCTQTEVTKSKGYISIEGQKFVDSNGRQVIFNGINFISKNPAEKYMPLQNHETFENFKKWGFNCIRLGIIWDGLEPEPGKYNEEYLLEIDKRIQWAAENEIYVFLDMHQDLYGAKFSDGAPDWATLDEGKPHYSGAVWSDSYMISPAVQTAFDNFWKNTPAADGVGLQDHYANLWKHIAKRYANNTTVIGYDIMNEPFLGSSANEIMPRMLGAYVQVMVEVTGQAPPTAEELQAMWGDEKSRLKALELVATKDRYSKVVDTVYELNADFEKNQLQPMYQKMADAIREVDQKHILFLNHSYFANTGVSSALEPTKLADGTTDLLIAYAAHGYDLVVDTKEVENPSYERVEFIFDRINKTGKRMNVPVLIGEWGALHGKSPKMIETARHLVDIMAKYNFNNTYWAFYNDIGDYPYFQNAIIRPYPQHIAGNLVEYDYNFGTGEFTCVWEETEDFDAPTEIYVPNLKDLSQKDIVMSPPSEQIVFEYSAEGNSGRLVVSPGGKNIKRKLSFTLHSMSGEDISIK
ncbi:MAG: cellulase family glycosylhydrolase [Draconibacterium sp.]|nr:cellulase family glycosylhydrolase [Draconibacterium sp.]